MAPWSGWKRAASHGWTRTVRKIRNASDADAVYLCAGGKDGYVGRDGQVPPGEEQRVRALHDLRSEQPSERAARV